MPILPGAWKSGVWLAGREKDTRVDGMSPLEGDRIFLLVRGDVDAACYLPRQGS
jgi:hypothetical protein